MSREPTILGHCGPCLLAWAPATDTCPDCGQPSTEALLVELAETRRALDEARRLQTLGGPPPPVDNHWANLALSPPASASDDTAPPLHRRTRDEQTVALPTPDPGSTLA